MKKRIKRLSPGKKQRLKTAGIKVGSAVEFLGAPHVSDEEGKAILRILDEPPKPALIRLMSRPKRWV